MRRPNDMAFSLEQVDGQFDIIFLDADKHNYQVYMDTILERRLLSPHGVVFVDNGRIPCCSSLLVRRLTCGLVISIRAGSDSGQ